MLPELPKMSLLQQRYLEARVLGPIIRVFQAEMGAAGVDRVARRAIQEMARERGRELAQQSELADLEAFAEVAKAWRSQGALTIQTLEESPTRYDFNVTRCRFAEMYREMGLADLGPILSCERDGSLCHGFSPEIALTRTQTIMQGAPFCDFRYTYEPASQAQGDREVD
jgi:predicted ArsR family transcriptional regulator